MALLRNASVGRRLAALAIALSFAIGLPALSIGDDTPPASKGQANENAKAKAKAKQADVARKKRERQKREDEENAKDAKPTPGLPVLPKKTIKAPTLTPAGLDELVNKFLTDTKAPPAALTTDVEFVRRVYLDVTGRVPTPEQTYAFVMSADGGKRSKLVNRLLNSPEYAANWARYWRDVIQYRATNENFGRVGYGELEDWLVDQFARNRPWDEIATEIMIGTGRNDENGAVVLALAHESQPVEIAGEVSRIFLGVQIQCAQCHDHPTDSWKRQQFHEFASFFAGTKGRRVEPKSQVFEVVHQGRPRYTMPDLKNPAKPIPVSPKWFLSSDAPTLPANLPSQERHQLAASYVTAQDNPWFAKAFVNRVWGVLMGEGFYSPIDDLGPDRKAKAPEVLETLASQWQQGGYDVRWLFRTILDSKAYQREVRSTLSASGRSAFASNCPSRLRADQILDSLSQVLNLPGLVQDPQPGANNKKQGAGKKGNMGVAADLKDAVGKTKGARLTGPRFNFNKLFGVDPSTPGDDILGTIPQALFLMNGPTVNRAIEARNGTVLGSILSSTPDNRKALNALYLRVLAREPSNKEVQVCGKYVASVNDRREAFEDILWSLINSTEFITRR